MATTKDKYTYRVMWSEEDAEYVGLCAEFPSLSWLSRTPETALTGIRKLVAQTLADLRGNGEVIPEPFAIRSYSGKLTIRISPEVHRQLALQAAEAGVSLTRWAGAKLSHW
jgi:predicted RNase H-like HicB family nuclease